VEKLIALQDEVLIPATPVEAESDRRARFPPRALGSPLDPAPKARGDRRGDDRRNPPTVVLPGKIVVPRPPGRPRDRRALLAHQAEVADRDRTGAVRCVATVGIGEGVELLDIAERMSRLPLDPGAQTRLQRAVSDLERARRQRPAV